MTTSQFHSLQIGDKVSMLPGVVNTITNQYIRVVDGEPQYYVTIDNRVTLPEEDAGPVVVKAVSHPVVLNTDGFESQPCCYDAEKYIPTANDDYIYQ